MQVIYIKMHIFRIFFQFSLLFSIFIQFSILYSQIIFLLSYKKKLVRIKFMKKTIIKSILVSLLVLTFFACQSAPTEIPADLSEQELTKLAQASYDNGNIKAATAYYEAIIERFGDNPDSFVAAKFELAHLLVKEKKYDEAKPILEEILGLYTANEFNSLPPEYKKLVEIDLAKITSKEN